MRTLSIAAMQTAPIARDPDATLDLLAKRAPAVKAAVPHAQLLVLPRYLDRESAWRVSELWHVLSRVAHHHAYELTPGGIVSRFGLFAAPEFVAAYGMLFVFFVTVAWWEKRLAAG